MFSLYFCPVVGYNLGVMDKIKKNLLEIYLYFHYLILSVCLSYGTLLYIMINMLFYSYEQDFKYLTTSYDVSFRYNLVYYTLIYCLSIIVPLAGIITCRKIVKIEHLSRRNLFFLFLVLILEIIIAFKWFD